MSYKENNNFGFLNIYHDIIECLIAALDAKDKYTSGHSKRVADMAYELARLIGITCISLEEIHVAAHVHDIGKIGIPDYILSKPGKLTAEEWISIKKHPEIGYNILKSSDKLSSVSNLVLYHHERWDGNGYPSGIKSTNIPLGSRIITICDSLDAIASPRSYSSARSLDECKVELQRNKGTQFDPALIDLLIANWDYWCNFREQSM